MTVDLANDMLDGAGAIATFLGGRWTAGRVRMAKHRGTLPIRTRPGMGLYAFKSELRAYFEAADALPERMRVGD